MKKEKEIFMAVKVIPNARRSEIAGWENGVLKVRLAAVPEKGEANEELIRFLAKELKVRRSQIELIHGRTSRTKRLKISEE